MILKELISVTTSFASAYLMAMAGGNLAGRLGWAAVSDKIGRCYTKEAFIRELKGSPLV